VNQVNGLLPASIPKNVYKVLARKGVTVLAGQIPQTAFATLEISIPAGADTADVPNVRAMLSLLIGAINTISSSIGDTVVTGVI
jgi:hypothetical protein